MNLDDLKPCPFCGGEPLVGSSCGNKYVYCTTCKCETEMHYSRDPAMEAWNKRVKT